MSAPSAPSRTTDTVICQTCHTTLPIDAAHDAGFGSCGEELFTCERHCPQCAPYDGGRHGGER